MAGHRNVTSPRTWKGDFPAKAFYKASIRYVPAIHSFSLHLLVSIPTNLGPVASGIFSWSRYRIQKPSVPTSWIFLLAPQSYSTMTLSKCKDMKSCQTSTDRERCWSDSEQVLSKRPCQCFLNRSICCDV